MKTLFSYASYMIPGTNEFYGDPLINEHPSKIVAAAKTVDGEISVWDSLIAFKRFSLVSWTPFSTSQNLSVFAVHKTSTLSKLLLILNSLIFYLIVSKCSYLLFPGKILSALSDWFAAIKSL